jgi:hypothetical protein
MDFSLAQDTSGNFLFTVNAQTFYPATREDILSLVDKIQTLLEPTDARPEVGDRVRVTMDTYAPNVGQLGYVASIDTLDSYMPYLVRLDGDMTPEWVQGVEKI